MMELIENQVYLAQGEYAKVIGRSEALLGMCEAMHYALVALHIRLQTAAAYEMLGKRETADELLISALAAAEPDALYLPFVENYRYLKTALTRGAGAKFAAFVRTVTPLGEDFVRRCGEKRAEGSRPAAPRGPHRARKRHRRARRQAPEQPRDRRAALFVRGKREAVHQSDLF